MSHSLGRFKSSRKLVSLLAPLGLPLETAYPSLAVVPVGLPGEIPYPSLAVVPVGLPGETANPSQAVVPMGLPGVRGELHTLT